MQKTRKQEKKPFDLHLKFIHPDRQRCHLDEVICKFVFMCTRRWRCQYVLVPCKWYGLSHSLFVVAAVATLNFLGAGGFMVRA